MLAGVAWIVEGDVGVLLSYAVCVGIAVSGRAVVLSCLSTNHQGWKLRPLELKIHSGNDLGSTGTPQTLWERVFFGFFPFFNFMQCLALLDTV